MIEKLFFYEFMGTDFYHTAYSFFVYGFCCWVMECIFETIRQKKLVYNRGFNKGPFCTIYGVAYLFVYFVMKPLDGKWIALFFLGMIYATLLEYVTAVLLDKLFHQKLWDYTDMPFSFQGRINLFISLAWGGLIVLFFAVLQPTVIHLIDLIPVRFGYPIVNVLIWIYFIDLAFSFASRSKFGKNMKDKFDDKKEEIKMHFRGGRA